MGLSKTSIFHITIPFYFYPFILFSFSASYFWFFPFFFIFFGYGIPKNCHIHFEEATMGSGLYGKYRVRVLSFWKTKYILSCSFKPKITHKTMKSLSTLFSSSVASSEDDIGNPIGSSLWVWKTKVLWKYETFQ